MACVCDNDVHCCRCPPAHAPCILGWKVPCLGVGGEAGTLLSSVAPSGASAGTVSDSECATALTLVA